MFTKFLKLQHWNYIGNIILNIFIILFISFLKSKIYNIGF